MDVLKNSDKLIVDKILLVKVIFELATAHEESFQYEEESLSAERLVLVQVCLECPKEGMTNYSSIIQSLFK